MVFFSYSSLPAAPDDPDVMKRGHQDRKARPISMFESTEPSTASLRKNQSSDDLARDAQVSVENKHKLSRCISFVDYHFCSYMLTLLKLKLFVSNTFR